MIGGRSFVVFSDDWGRHPSSCQHLFRRLAPGNRVIWVNTIGTRLPTWSRADFARAAGKIRAWTAGSLRASGKGETSRPGPASHSTVRVLEPFMTPFDRWPAGRRVNAALLRRALRRVLAADPGDAPILVTTIPNAAGVVGSLGECLAVYYCVDDFSEWPGADRATMLSMERELLARVDLVIATSEKLFEDKSAVHPRVRLLRHGVDVDAFRAGTGRVSPALAALTRPIAGSTGLIDARVDVALVECLARARPDVTFAFIGPRQLAVGPLDSLANVRFLPPVDYEDIPATVHALDVAILPYVETPLTERINPLKLREYLASGVPVVATPLPEVARFGDVIELARSALEWEAALARALKEARTRTGARRARVAGESWEVRAEEFSRHLTEAEDAAAPAASKPREAR